MIANKYFRNKVIIIFGRWSETRRRLARVVGGACEREGTPTKAE